MGKSKRRLINNTVKVECYRMPGKDLRDLMESLMGHEAVIDFKKYKEESVYSGTNIGVSFGVVVVQFLAEYADGKILDFIRDQATEWFGKKRRTVEFIRLEYEGEWRRVGGGLEGR